MDKLIHYFNNGGLLLIGLFVLSFNSTANTFIVTDPSDLNDNIVPYSLRDAISLANSFLGIDNIQFNLSGAGVHSIQLTSNDLIITEGVIIDGTTQPGYNAASPQPLIEIWNSGGNGFLISSTASGTSIKTICINRCMANGLYVGATNFTIQGCFIGIDPTGTISKANNQNGIYFSSGTSGHFIGGSTIQERNIISGNGSHGITIQTGSGISITGNFIGTDITGGNAIGNSGDGIIAYSNSVSITIGGASSALRNVISGNMNHGVEIQSCSTMTVAGNYIGLGYDGATALGNGLSGVLFYNNSDNIQIGGSLAGQGNVIASNGNMGIDCNTSTNIVIRHNYVGVTADGLSARGNLFHGVQVISSPATILGGNRATEGNIISNSGIHGINYNPGGDGGIIQGNLIGTDINGTAAMGNADINIVAKSNNMIIGGNTSAYGNVIVDAKSTTIGTGILLANANNATVKNNLIGIGLDKVTALGNVTAGINISVENAGMTASNNTIEFNTIAYNGYGVSVGATVPIAPFGAGGFSSCDLKDDNLIVRNSIYCNTLKGISLNLGSCDNGNNGHPAPILNSSTATNTFVQGTASPNDSIHIYSQGNCLSCSQGKVFIAAIKADASGNWGYTYALGFSGQTTATATDASNNTSEFATCVTILPVVFINVSSESLSDEIKISWSTASETNNNYFEIQRSLDGIHFTTIGTINGAGNTNQISQYSFYDKDPLGTNSYYRIKQIDYNGQYTVSEMVYEKVSEQNAFCYVNNQLKSLIIKLNDSQQNIDLTLYNELGQIILENKVMSITGSEVVSVDISSVANGFYLALIQGSDSIIKRKIVIAKN